MSRARRRAVTPRSRAAARRAATAEFIVERIGAAIAERRLPPGTKLGEKALGEIFGVSRTKVRQALHRLATDKLVTLLPHRGAFVAQPTVREAREVFEARRVLEPIVVARFVEGATPDQIETLLQHHAQEQAAIAANDARSAQRLLGWFHVLIAEMAGNRVLAEVLRELVMRSSLITLLYQTTADSRRSSEEHRELITHIEKREVEQATQLAIRHLERVEAGLALREPTSEVVDLKSALAAVGAG